LSPGDLKPVFAAILENAARICDAKFGALLLCEGDGFRAVATHNAPLKFSQAMSSIFHPPSFTAIGRAANTKQAAQIVDIKETKGYVEGHPFVLSATEFGGFRTVLSVPMLRERELVGIISIYRQEVHRFTDKQIELVRHFANQAVIAIENTRLLNELRQRTDDLTESLEQQTATSEVLRAISSSPGEVRPVFQTILENATHICQAKYGNLYIYNDDAFQIVASHSADPALAAERLRGPPILATSGTGLSRVLRTKTGAQIEDVLADPDYPKDDPLRTAAARGAFERFSWFRCSRTTN
jgi:two-component system NtrC family sensor kinase